MTSDLRYLSLALNFNSFFQNVNRKRHCGFVLMSLLSIACQDTFADYRLLPCPEEQQSANKTLQRIENEWPTRGSGDPVSQYVQQLGLRLAQSTQSASRFFWRFSVVRNLAPNAFSIGNGYVFLTEGALNLAQNESELAAILAHELGHELAGHFCKEPGSIVSNSLFDIFNPKQTTQYRVGIGSMMQTIDPVKEQQADRIALSILQSAGLNPHAMLDISRRLPTGNVSHFTDVLRLQDLEHALANIPPRWVESSAPFISTKQQLVNE